MATVVRLTNTPKGFQTIIENGRHSLLGDEPVKSNGTDLGFAPTELVLSGLGMCKVATVRYIARKKNWEIADVKAEISQEVKFKDGKNHIIVHTKMEILGNLTDEQRQTLISEADKCYVHRLIHDGVWDIAPIELTTI